jgi:hypothetical protein
MFKITICPSYCGEKIYDAQAMRKIETYSPCFVRKRQYKISA